MATLSHFCGVKTPYPSLFKRSVHFPQLDFVATVPFASVPSKSVKASCCERVQRLICKAQAADVVNPKETKNESFGEVPGELTCVMKFGGSSVASAERMREVADLILSFPEERPVVVLSAMGKTTNNLLLVLFQNLFKGSLSIYNASYLYACVFQAGEKAQSCGVSNVSDLQELAFVKELHLR